MIFARKWRQWRQSEDWTARRLHTAIGVSSGYWSKVESGKKPPPTDDVIRRACDAMGSPERAGYWQTIARWDRVERTMVNPPSWVKRWIVAGSEWDAVGHVPTTDELDRVVKGE